MPAEVSEGKSRMLPPLPPLAPELPAHGMTPPPLPAAAFVEGGGYCANCLSPLMGPFCSRCGQHVADYHQSVWRFVLDFFDSAFSWDNKYFRTLGPLLKRPGWLTQEFMAGRRVRYVHPLRLFLFTSFVCLAVLQWTHSIGIQMRVQKAKDLKHLVTSKAPATHRADDEDDEDAAKASPSPSLAPASSPAAATPVAPTAPVTPAVAPSPPAADDLNSMIRETVKSATSGDRGKEAALDKRWENFGERIQKRIDAAGGMEKFNERMTTNVQSKLSWVALAMLPIFALFMKMAFGRAGGYYFTYLVFSLHYHTFLLMFWVVYALLSGIADASHLTLLQIVAALVLFIPPWYLFRALRQMYGQGWSVTAGKVFAIGTVHLLTLFAGLAMIGATAFL